MQIKYIIKELRALIKTETLVICMICLAVISACILMFFSFGFVHHIEQKKVDGESGEKQFVVDFYDPGWPLDKKKETVEEDRVNKGNIIELLSSLDERVLKNCSVIAMEGKYPEDVVDDYAIDNSCLAVCMEFGIDKGSIVPADNEKELKEQGILADGRYFNTDDYDQNRHVCLVPKLQSANLTGEYEKWADKYAPDSEGFYTIEGIKYECIGHVNTFTQIPKIPVTQISDGIFIKYMVIGFDSVINRYTYESLYNSLKQKYGDQAMIKPIEIIELDSQRFYNKLTVAMGMMAMACVVIMGILYHYLIIRRKRFFRVLYICGMKDDMKFRIVMGEIMLIFFTAYLISVGVFHFLVLPVMEKSFEYLRLSYSMAVYLKIGFLFWLIGFIGFGIMIRSIMNDKR